MGRVVTGVTLQTFPEAVHQAGLKPGQKFTMIVEGESFDRASALRRLDEISTAVSARMAADGIVTEEQKDAFIQSLFDEK